MQKDYKIAIIGLGYVGLPLAVAFAEKYKVVGFDINLSRVGELKKFNDRTLEISDEQLQNVIVSDENYINDNYSSGLKFNQDFYAGYSPERINPGDKEHTVTKILKVTSGSTPEIATEIDAVYNSVITAGTHKAPSIKVAEAAKVIENSQRDINIAFVNELAKIFNLMVIDTHDVLEAAGTKWNFLKFKPGLVGGHCIGVDPYYLAQKAQELGYHPEIILAGRRLNDEMGKYVAIEVIKLMLKKDIKVKNSNVLVLGFTFKEDCPDVRNTKVIDIINELNTYDVNVTIFDPWANPEEVMHEYKVVSQKKIPIGKFDSVILAVSHKEFLNMELKSLLNENAVFYDVKGCISEDFVDSRL